MGYKGPKINYVQFYSMSLDEHLTLAFESLDLIPLQALGQIVHTKSYDQIELIPKLVHINTIDNTIVIIGSQINDSTYIIQKNGDGEQHYFSYNCSKETIITAIEYLYHMYKNLV